MKIDKCVFTFLIILILVTQYCYAQTIKLNQENLLSKTSATYTNESSEIEFEELIAYKNKIDSVLKLKIPVYSKSYLNDTLNIIQNIAIYDSVFTLYCIDSTKQACRNEIIGVYKSRSSEIRDNKYINRADLYRVEMYNFTKRITSIATVSYLENKVIYTAHYKDMQPDISESLKKIALKIALNNVHVKNELGYKPTELEALMVDTKTSLNRSTCEKSQHLCVAPTFIKINKAFWVIVDLNLLKVVGTRWTAIGDNVNASNTLSERKTQNEFISNCFCYTNSKLQQNNWDLSYNITNSDGLKIADVTYKNKKILESVTLVDWHVNYSMTDGFGYSDAVGCPYFSSATVVALEPPKVENVYEENKVTGFSLTQFFRSDDWPNPCNYEYYQKYIFFNDGRIKLIAASVGRGCGTNGTYSPVFRIEFPFQNSTIEKWKGKEFEIVKKENWYEQLPTTPYFKNNIMFKWTGSNFNVDICPTLQDNASNTFADNAFIYFTLNDTTKQEGHYDLPTIGPCCNIDYQQGPDKFMNPVTDEIKNKPIVMWYVSRMKNNNEKGKERCWAERVVKDGAYQDLIYPCESGPVLIPHFNK